MADDNIVEFKKKPKTPEMVWECTCGCQLWYLEDEGARCFKCSRLMNYYVNIAGNMEELFSDDDE